MVIAARNQISGMNKVLALLTAQSLKARTKRRATVGYSAPYAGAVHENLTANHAVGQAKFLEQPTRQYLGEMERIIRFNLRNKESLETSLNRAAWFLYNESQPLVPVLTGFLRDSGYIKMTS